LLIIDSDAYRYIYRCIDTFVGETLPDVTDALRHSVHHALLINEQSGFVRRLRVGEVVLTRVYIGFYVPIKKNIFQNAKKYL
jgi:hypothetical protein